MQFAIKTREEILDIIKDAPYTVEKKDTIDEKVNFAIHYLEKGMYQFPHEWRSYWAAGFVLEAAGQNSRAKEYFEKGLEMTPDYDIQAKERLKVSLQSVSMNPDLQPVEVEKDEANLDSSSDDALDSTTKEMESE